MIIKGIEFKNFKNIKESKIDFKSCISAIYGPNGSGKTAVVDSVELLQKVYLGGKEDFNERKDFIENRMKINSNDMNVKYFLEYKESEYIIELDFNRQFDDSDVSSIYLNERVFMKQSGEKNNRKKFNKVYEIESSPDIFQIIKINSDTIEYNNHIEDHQNKLYKEAVGKNTDILSSFNVFINDNNFSESTKHLFEKIIQSIFILGLEDMGIFNLKFGLPIAFHLESENSIKHGKVPCMFFKKENFYDNDYADLIIEVFKQISEIFKLIVPGSELLVEKENTRKVNDKDEVQLELYILRDGGKIPLSMESTGTVKIISMLSALIHFSNNREAIVIIDEFDSHIFEFLLNEILRVLYKNSSGQLIFTTHNFSVMENLDKECIILSTSLEDNVMYNYFKRVTSNNNLRDKYIRALSLGTEEYVSALNINEHKIKNTLDIIKRKLNE